MKIVQEPSEVYGTDLVEVIAADYADNFAIRLVFSNGIQSIVDFKPFLQNSRHPSVNILMRNYFRVSQSSTAISTGMSAI
ncbi:MAG: hypothetical protein KG029_16470 [Bacteroidetes bacterium]|nr:hypothetical protein [Bacteroidota bacterium]